MKHEHIQPSLKGGAHIVHRFVFADASAKTALNDTNKGTLSLGASDVGSICRVVSDDTFHILTNHSPITWKEVAAGASPGGSSGQIQYNDGAGAFAGSAAKVSAAGAVDLPEIAAPSTPSSGFASIYISDGPSTGAPPRIHTKDSAGLVRTIYPAIERQAVGTLKRQDSLSTLQLGPKGTTETTASFTDSTSEFIVMALVRISPQVTPMTSQSSSFKSFSAIAYRGGKSTAFDYCRIKQRWSDMVLRDETDAMTSVVNYNAATSTGVLVFHQTDDYTTSFGRKGIGIGIPGLTAALGGWVDYSSAGVSNNGGRLEFAFSNGTALLALAVCDGRAGVAGAGTHPWSAATTNAFATQEESVLSYMKAHDIFMREGTIRNLSTAEIGGSNALVWDKLYLPEDCTVDSSGKVTAWPANSASADQSPPNITLVTTNQGDIYRFPVTWCPGL